MITLLAIAIPASAQVSPDDGAWKVKGDFAMVTTGGIAVPVKAGSVSLSQTGEASQKGKGVDNIAQYESEDRKVFATIYIFYATYADTALATWATDRAIHERFGPNLILVSDTIVAAGGVPQAATRRLYDKAELEPGKPMVTAAGFVRAGRWMIAVRVSGPAGRRPEVEGAFDALLSGMRFDGKDRPMPAAPLKLAATCPASDEKPARFLGDKASGSNALFSSLTGGSITVKDVAKGTVTEQAPPLAFPHNGTSTLCIRGKIAAGGAQWDVLAPASADDGQIALVLLDDAGGTVAVEPLLLLDKDMGKGFVVKRYGIGVVDVLGSFDKMPNLAQLGAIVSGTDRRGAMIRSSTVFTPDGKSTINIDPDMLK
ncbi:hypothetical protein ABC974_19020 [Sphingomonas oligophenolica]|uniref:Uncharacterized protein n=1 Tax=Sphingomonas oligophenolica TaxID=301154 RepID=A0ABU9Y7F8_9SPHN